MLWNLGSEFRTSVFVGSEKSRECRDQIAVVHNPEVVLDFVVQLARKNAVANPWRPEPDHPQTRSMKEKERGGGGMVREKKKGAPSAEVYKIWQRERKTTR